jgi:hypothetical protein
MTSKLTKSKDLPPSSSSDLEVGSHLIDSIVTMTGLPQDMVQCELEKIINNSGHSKDNLELHWWFTLTPCKRILLTTTLKSIPLNH